MARVWRTLSVAVMALLCLILLLPDRAEAQRRRSRRGRAGTPPTAPAAPDGSAEGGAAPPDAAATPPASPPAGETVAPAPATPPAAPSPGTTAPSAPPPSTQRADPSAPAAQPASAGDPGPLPPDLAPIRQEYVQLMDEMVQARSRVAIVGQELFHARMTITVHDRTGDEQTLTRFLLELDGTPIHRTDGEIEGGASGRQLFEGALAPGPHVLTIEMEQRSREDAEFRTTQRESFRFIVVRDRLSEITIELEDDSHIAREFRSGGEGRFEIRTRVRVAARALPES